MNLGSLVTITAEAATNLVLIVLDNGVYEVTGAQSTPGSAGARRDQKDVDYAGMARACGFARCTFADLEMARRCDPSCGNHVLVVKIAPMPDGSAPGFPGPGPARALAFQAALAR
jgi:thiamine pyrophosphate-dependent acetolactate synthase large subunit-like protein